MTTTERRRSRCLPRIRLGAIVAIVTLGVLLIPTLIAGRPGRGPQTGPTYQVLYTFTGGADGANPSAGVIMDPIRKLYVGTTQYGGRHGHGTVFGVSPVTGHEIVLHSFTGDADGGGPLGSLIEDSSGNLYGTTKGGGWGSGVVFELTPTGQETALYTFTGGSDGSWPEGALVRDAAGNLYGTTWDGGDSACYGGWGCGTVFEVSATGQETVLYSFTWGLDGGFPNGELVRDAAGNLYGTTWEGGTYGYGVVFEMSPTGQETVLYNFNGPGGANPKAGLMRDAAGNFYGTTGSGGTYSAGVVFGLNPAGQEEVLYTFTGSADGSIPLAGLIRDPEHNLYGTTVWGGQSGCYYDDENDGCGVVFEVSPVGQETVLYSFAGGTDGGNPLAGLARDATGNLYGTTYQGGIKATACAYGCGVVFKLTP